MPRRYLPELLLLAALWGASFLFMRVAAPEFGPVPLIAMRVGIAALVLLPVLYWRKQLGLIRRHIKPLAFVGLTNSALPFSLFAFATLSLTAGLTAVLNSTAPFWTALVAFFFYGDKLSTQRVLGILVGFAGVLVLVWPKLSASGALLAIGACLLASMSYGVSANYSKHKLEGVPPLVSTVGSQVTAALMLLPLAILYWPSHGISLHAWLAAAALGIACTGLAYLLFFRLIAQVGPANAVMVTFLIPVFGNLWGALFLDESVTLSLLLGGLVILAGVAISLALLRPKALPA
ncbi:MAG: DMT family transporter [Pseudomonadota bacterium]|uniref:DMT family transporter n=1 Tax=Gallaecimonas pentaromativorans TaxID=584787 RepID=UPI00067EDE3E|nr:DMT family transporter [Gallaecimonas pentaromativorans]MED5525208.1 DMT family transporter [Pseudomonadota bacterium]